MFQQRFIETNGIRMEVAEVGSGPLVLLCHGWPESWHSWRHQMKALAAAGYHAVAPNQRGYGATDRPERIDQYTIFHLVGDLVGLVSALGERSAVLVGHDWGAQVVWNAALLRPDVFRAVAAMSVPYTPRAPLHPTRMLKKAFGDAFFYQLYFQEPGVAEAELEQDIRATLRRTLYSASGQGMAAKSPQAASQAKRFLDTTIDPPTLPAWLSEADLDHYAAEFERSGFRGPLNWYRNIDRNWEQMGAFAGVKVQPPALFLAGRLDPVLHFPGLAQAVENLGSLVPDLRQTVLVDDCGHWIQQEKPEETTAALLAFLRGL